MSEATGVRNGCTPSGKELPRGLQPLLNENAVFVNIGAPVELHIDKREGDIGVRAQTRDARDAHERAFQRLRDSRLDFLGSQPRRFRENRPPSASSGRAALPPAVAVPCKYPAASRGATSQGRTPGGPEPSE